MTRKRLLHFLLLFTSSMAFSQQSFQDTSMFYRYELSGVVEYNNSEKRFPGYYGSGLDMIDQLRTFTVRPTIGYFIVSFLEFSFDLFYRYEYAKYNNYWIMTTSNGDYVKEVYYDRWSQNIGFDIGPILNIRYIPDISFFIGAKIGLGWTRRYDGRAGIDFGWSEKEVTYPILLCGFKIFFIHNWALILQWRYYQTFDYQGYKNYKYQSSSVGMGIAVYLP